MEILPKSFVTPDYSLREKIERLLGAMRTQTQATTETVECHGGGMFSRTLFLKKGDVLIGKIHLTEHINIMSSGDITVVTEEGDKRLTGFNIMACKPGTRRVGVVHEDTVWTTMLRTAETDLRKIEELFFAKSHAELEN